MLIPQASAGDQVSGLAQLDDANRPEAVMIG